MRLVQRSNCISRHNEPCPGACKPTQVLRRSESCLWSDVPAAACCSVCPADYKSRIVQRGGVPPLIRMLSSTDLALKEMAAFALGRLAQNTHNQAGIVQVRAGTSPVSLFVLVNPTRSSFQLVLDLGCSLLGCRHRATGH
jgi:hypothetical protein